MSNWTTVSATNIKNLNNTLLASGTLVFQATDANNVPVSFQVGGGGHILRTPFSVAITNGAVTSFSIPDPIDTNPSGIFYRVTVLSAQGIVLEYRLVSFTGATFNFDNYAPSGGAVVPPTGGTIFGNLSIAGNLTVTGSTSFSTGLSVVAIASSHSIVDTDEIIEVTAGSGGDRTLTLPTVVGRAGRTFRIVRVDAGTSNVIIATTSSQTINGDLTLILSNQWQWVWIMGNATGTAWILIGSGG